MLISPPFLPARPAGQVDAAWIDAAMPVGEPGDGAFPLSYNLGWHGGRHVGGDIARAIADGTVAYVRQPTAMPPDQAARQAHALNYYRGWTSDGVVVIRHESEIGATPQGVATRVVFFSIYMHLHSIDAGVRQGQRIYRKSPVGQAGHIYGQPGKIHFEIVCDDDNLQRLVGRSEGGLPMGADGRSDAVYGELYFTLPSTAQVYQQRPGNTVAIPNGGAQLGEALCVGLRYAEGDGPAGARGHLQVTSYRPDGSSLGAPLAVADGEYHLYRDASAISNAYPAGARPAPSAVYELLRFGRVLGPDALTPADVPHWREVRTPTGQGWVNLNGAGVHTCSDADFPHWRGWKLVDDDTDGNSQCNSATIRAWLDEENNQQVVYEADIHSATTQEARRRLDSDDVKARLRKVIGKFPTEWDAGNFDVRFGWLKDKTDENPNPLDPENYPRLKAHVEALQFWSAANLQVPQYDDLGEPAGSRPLAGVHWHFDPREFIRHFRMCGWLSVDEMLRCLPIGHGVPGVPTMRARLTVGVSGRQLMPSGMYQSLNRTRNKYCVLGSIRTSQFMGQIAVETDRLQTVREYATGEAYQGRRDLDNLQPGDGRRFRGRGVIQLTGRTNYERYEIYRGQDFTTDPNPLVIEASAHAACDASGFYWTAESTRDRTDRLWRLDGLSNINRRSDSRTFGGLQDAIAIDADVLNVTRQVNRAALHITERRIFFRAAYYALSDETTPATGIANLRP